MAHLNANADAIISAGIETKDVAKDLNNLMNEFYPRLERIQSDDVWISGNEQGSASVFLRAVAKDKPLAQALPTNIDGVGESLIQFGKDMNTTASIKR